MTRAAFVSIAVLALAACKGGKHHAEVDGVLVPQARSGFDAPDGPTLHIPGDDLTRLPDASVIKIAAYRKTPWVEVRDLIKRIEAEGKTAVPLVGKRTSVRGFRLSDPVKGKTIAVTVRAEGTICVNAPGMDEGLCSVDPMEANKHVDLAATRWFVREAVTELEIYQADLVLQGDFIWDDVVRAIDGVRTCCDVIDTPVKVAFPF